MRQGENEGLEEISNNFEGRIDGSDEEIDDETTSFSEEEELLFRRRLEEGYDLFDARYQAWLELNSTDVYDSERLLNNGPSGTLMSSSSSMSLSGPDKQSLSSNECLCPTGPPMSLSDPPMSSFSGPPIDVSGPLASSLSGLLMCPTGPPIYVSGSLASSPCGTPIVHLVLQ